MTRLFSDRLARGQREHGEKWDPSVLQGSPEFIRYFESQQRVKVVTTHGDNETYERTGTISTTSGWRPAWLLMHRSNAMGSSDLLSSRDRIVAVQHGKRYASVVNAGTDAQ